MREALVISLALVVMALCGRTMIEAPAKVAATILQAQDQRW